MKHTGVLLLMSTVFCLFLCCSADRSNPVVPADNSTLSKAGIISIDTAISWTGSQLADPCSDELLVCTGSMRFQYQIVPDGSDGWHITSHMMSENFVATNRTTGMTYRVHESSTYSAQVRPPYPIVSNQTIKVNLRGSDGSRFQLHYHLHVTLDKTGEVRVRDYETKGVCP